VHENKKKSKRGENDRKAGAHKKRPIRSTKTRGRGRERIVCGKKAAMATRCLAGSLPLLSASTAAAAAARAQPLPSAAAPRRVPTRLSVATGGEQQLITAQDPAHGESLLLLAVACYYIKC